MRLASPSVSSSGSTRRPGGQGVKQCPVFWVPGSSPRMTPGVAGSEHSKHLCLRRGLPVAELDGKSGAPLTVQRCSAARGTAKALRTRSLIGHCRRSRQGRSYGDAMPLIGRLKGHLGPARLADMARWGFPAQGRRAARPDLSPRHVSMATQLGNRFTPMHRRSVHTSSGNGGRRWNITGTNRCCQGKNAHRKEKDGRIKSGHDEGGLGMRAVPHTPRHAGGGLGVRAVPHTPRHAGGGLGVRAVPRALRHARA